MKTIYYSYPTLSSFIRLDLRELSKKNKLLTLTQQWSVKWKLPFNLFRQFLFLLRHSGKMDAMIVSFAGYHSLLPVWFGKRKKIPVYIILNGTDSVSIPALNYGSHLKKILRFFCRYSVMNAEELWPVSQFLIELEDTYSGKHATYGIRSSFPDCRTPFTVIPNGFDLALWEGSNSPISRKGFITVIPSEDRLILKGIDLFIELAVAHSELPCTIVGMSAPENMSLPPNVQFTGRITQLEMKDLFFRHTYYLQLSMFEGFGCSLAEGMLCGCIPIVSNVNAMPLIAGETGFVLMQKDVGMLLGIIREALSESADRQAARSYAASQRIREHFPIEKRVAEMNLRMEKYDASPGNN